MRTFFISALVFFSLVSSCFATTCSVASSATVPIGTAEDITVSCSDVGTGYSVTITPSGYTSSCITVSPASSQVTASSPSTTFSTTGVSMSCAANVNGRKVTWTFSHSGGNSIASKTTVYNVIPTPSITPTFSQTKYNVTNGTSQNVSITLSLTTSQSQVDIRNINIILDTSFNGSTILSGLQNRSGITIDVSESTTQYITWNLELPPLPPGMDYDFNVTVTADNANPATGATIINVTTSSGISSATANIGLVANGAGWNLISLPVQTSNVSIPYLTSTITGNFSVIYAWNSVSQAYEGYDPLYPLDSTLRNMTIDKGYFVKMMSADTLSVTGNLPSSTAINMRPGWNMVGYPSDSSSPVGTALSAIAGKYQVVYTWNPTTQLYYGYDPRYPGDSILQNMTYGKGYFVKINSSQVQSVTI